MELGERLESMDTEQVLFAGGGVLAAALTLLVILNSDDVVQRFLFLCFTAYMFGAAVPAVTERVPDYRRTGAIALGAVGAVGYVAGTASTLPLLFVLAGVAALLGII